MAKDFEIQNDITSASDESKFAKAMQYDAVLPADYTTTYPPQEYAIYCDAPSHMSRDLNDIDLNQYLEELGGGFKEIRDRRNAVAENNDRIAAENEPKSADYGDPPKEDKTKLMKNADFGSDLNKEENENDVVDEDLNETEKSDFNFSDDAINGANNALQNKGYKLEPINNVNLGNLEDSFWNSSGKGGGDRNENTWEQNMQNYPEILNRLNDGQSLDEISEDEKLSSTCNTLFNDKQPITLDTSDPDNVTVSDGRHRIAMAQRLGYTHLPIKQ